MHKSLLLWYLHRQQVKTGLWNLYILQDPMVGSPQHSLLEPTWLWNREAARMLELLPKVGDEMKQSYSLIKIGQEVLWSIVCRLCALHIRILIHYVQYTVWKNCTCCSASISNEQKRQWKIIVWTTSFRKSSTLHHGRMRHFSNENPSRKRLCGYTSYIHNRFRPNIYAQPPVKFYSTIRIAYFNSHVVLAWESDDVVRYLPQRKGWGEASVWNCTSSITSSSILMTFLPGAKLASVKLFKSPKTRTNYFTQKSTGFSNSFLLTS